MSDKRRETTLYRLCKNCRYWDGKRLSIRTINHPQNFEPADKQGYCDVLKIHTHPGFGCVSCDTVDAVTIDSKTYILTEEEAGKIKIILDI